MASSTTKVAVYIGRFQPLHLGHTHVLQNALRNYDAVIVLVGSAYQARTIKNPFTFGERQDMLLAWMSRETQVATNKQYRVLPLRDQPYNDAKWIQSVQEQVDGAVKSMCLDNVEITLTGSDRDESTWYLRAFPQWKLDLQSAVPPGEDLSATNLRQRLFNAKFKTPIAMDWEDVPVSTYNFLKLFMETSPVFNTLKEEFDFIRKYKQQWSAAPYPVTFLTVDAVVIQSGHVLVIERDNLPGRGLWALPGGFLNQGERLMDGSIRELIEETGIRLAEGKKSKEITAEILRGSIRAKEIFDRPDRSLRGRTVTTAFLYRLDDTKPLPKVKGQFMPLHETGGKKVVETRDAFWLPIHEARANSERWFEDHHAILDTMLGMIKD